MALHQVFCRHHRRFGWCIWRDGIGGWASLQGIRITGLGPGAARVLLLRFQGDASWASAGAGAVVGVTRDIWMDHCTWRDRSVRYCTNYR